MNLLSKYIRLSKEEKMLFFEALFFLFYSKVYLFLPFRYCIRQLDPTGKIIEEGDAALLRKIQSAVYRANKLAFWKNVCLVKSFAARLMLQRRNIGSVMFLGLQFKNGKELVAHAWLIASGIYITPKGRTKYKEIFSV